MKSNDILEQLAAVIAARRDASPETSYVASLHAAGLDRILRKVGEECTETIVAAKNADPQSIVYETADLWFHTLIMLAHQGLGPADVLAELERRFGLSGIEEKASRADESLRR